MTSSNKANDLQIKSLDATTLPTGAVKSTDPRVEAFLERLRAKAEALDKQQSEKHVTVKEPRRRRPTADQSATPDWYQAVAPEPKKKAPTSIPVKRFSSTPGRKAKTS